MKRQKRRALVTGGGGFIGSHLAERLLTEGHEVVVIDNLSNGRMENISSLLSRPDFCFHKADVTDAATIRPWFENVDWVFHLAALADIVPSIQRPLEYYHANVTGTICVVEAARRAGVKRFIYAASSSCYGVPDIFPTPETAPIRPQYPYALTKYLGEEIVMHWAKVYKLPAVSLRLFNVYGPRARTSGTYGAVFGVFLAQKLSGKPLTVVGDGKQTRDFTYVTDVVEAFMKAAEGSIIGEVLNVGSGDTYSINQLIQLLEGDKVNIPKRPGEPDCTFADISKITKQLGWKPQISFQTGVGRMLEVIDNWREAPVWTPASIQEATETWFQYLS